MRNIKFILIVVSIFLFSISFSCGESLEIPKDLQGKKFQFKILLGTNPISTSNGEGIINIEFLSNNILITSENINPNKNKFLSQYLFSLKNYQNVIRSKSSFIHAQKAYIITSYNLSNKDNKYTFYFYLDNIKQGNQIYYLLVATTFDYSQINDGTFFFSIKKSTGPSSPTSTQEAIVLSLSPLEEEVSKKKYKFKQIK